MSAATTVPLESAEQCTPGLGPRSGRLSTIRSSIACASERGQRELVTLYRLLKHPQTPWHVRVVAAAAVGYVASPVQLIPSFIPVIGQLDDVCVVFAGSRLMRALVQPSLLAECADGALPGLPISLMAGAAVVGAAMLALILHLTG